jgi:hypothetical protein
MLIPIHFYNITGRSHREMMAEILRRRQMTMETAAENKPNEGDNAHGE